MHTIIMCECVMLQAIPIQFIIGHGWIWFKILKTFSKKCKNVNPGTYYITTSYNTTIGYNLQR